jgi:Kdo2-lipid IVA lauroyltransferase/acyltransferase
LWKVSRMVGIIKALLGAATFPLAILPKRAALGLGGFLAVVVAYLWRGRRNFATDNIRRAVEAGAITIQETPEIIARKSFENLGKAFMENIRIYHGRGNMILDHIRVVGRENYEKAQAKGKGVLVITGHCGNWELMAIAFARWFSHNSVVARPLNNRYVNQILEDLRRTTGNDVIYKDGAIRKILTKLRNNETVGILMDQAVLKEESCLDSFLGRPALTTKLPALMARKTGAPVVPIIMHRDEDGGHTIVVHPEVELSTVTDKDLAVQMDTKKFSSYIEAYIREYPTQWLWGHRRWKRAPEDFPEDFPCGTTAALE